MFSFQQEIKDQLREEQEEWAPETRYWRASDTGKCLRQRYYKRAGVPFTKPYDDRTLRVFRAGDIFHEWLQGLAEQRGVLVAKEAEVWGEGVIGHFDALIKPNGSDELYLYDFKSKHSYGFKYLNTDGAQKDHKAQVTLYKMLIEKNGYATLEEIDGEEVSVNYPPAKVTSCRILYISKDDLRVLEFDGQADEEEIKEEYRILNKAWENQILPPCTCHEMYNGNGHKYCAYNQGDSCCSENLIKGRKHETSSVTA